MRISFSQHSFSIMATARDIFHRLLSEQRLFGRMQLATEFRAALRGQSFPLITDNEALFLWDGASKHVSIVGDWTHWRHHIPMRRIGGTTLFYHTQEFPRTARLQYKFVVDGIWHNDPNNPHASDEGFGTNSEFMMPDYKDESYLTPTAREDGRPLVRGEIVRLECESTHLPEKREVFLYLPHIEVHIDDGIEASINGDARELSSLSTALPLLVLHDGAEALSLGKFHHILDHCIHAELITPCVAIFIAPHLPRRNEEYTLHPDYVRFCMEEAIPQALSEASRRGYEISARPAERCMVGVSLGGLLSTYIVLHHPEKFGVVFAQSPAYWWQKGIIFHEEHLSNASRIAAVLQTGTIADAHALTLKMRGMLSQRGAQVVYHEFVQGHTWGNWRTSFAQGICAWQKIMTKR